MNPDLFAHKRLLSALAILLLAVIGMGGFIVWQSTRGPIGPPPVLVPDHSVNTLVAPIKAKLSQDPA